MTDSTFAWLIFGFYALVTLGLALRGASKTGDMASFAVGNKDMGPALVGITLAASMASTATFIINPGFVYAYGLSAMMAFTVPLFVGMILGLVLMSKRFRVLGDKYGALTLPHWIEQRFGSRGLGAYFSVLTLLNLAYMVLIVVGSAYVMHLTLGLTYKTSVVFVVVFVFAYTMLGGTYAHAYTNSIQGVMMVIVAVVLFASGLSLLGDFGTVSAQITAESPHYFSLTNPDSPFFQTHFEVIVCAFVMGFAMVTQPHLMTKSLYLRSPSDVRKFVLIGGGTFMIFSLVYFVGFYARAWYPGIAAQDTVVAVYMAKIFTPKISILISVVVLAAAMSTLDGLLVAVSSIVAHDLVRHLVPKTTADRLGNDGMAKLSLWSSRGVIVALGIAVLFIALEPPELVAIFGGVGLYGILAGSAMPIVAGVFIERIATWAIWASALIGPAIHFALYFADFNPNPAVTATWGIFASVVPIAIGYLLERSRGGESTVASSPKDDTTHEPHKLVAAEAP